MIYLTDPVWPGLFYTEWERAMILSGYRRVLSTTAARASSGCLLGRLARVGEGHRAAARRRAWAKREGERLEDERRAHWRAHIQGRGVHDGLRRPLGWLG